MTPANFTPLADSTTMFSCFSMSFWCLVAALALTRPACSREIVFPPVAGVDAHTGHVHQTPLGTGLDVMEDLSVGPAFAGLSTYANLPYVQCMSSAKDVEKYDIAFLGAPFDTVCTPPTIACHLERPNDIV